ncbi:MAG: Lrp/AsnC family transcriptional regulator [Geminicoccaceae bacterium]
MGENTNQLRRPAATGPRLDERDEMLLGLLARDASLPYAELGRQLNLSAPAVHERVKRLKRDGVIRTTAALLDGEKLGRKMLAFIEVITEGWGKSGEMLALRDLPEVEEMHSVTGEACVFLKVRTVDAQQLEDLLERIYRMQGVRGTKSAVVLSTFLERGPLPLAG